MLYIVSDCGYLGIYYKVYFDMIKVNLCQYEYIFYIYYMFFSYLRIEKINNGHK